MDRVVRNGTAYPVVTSEQTWEERIETLEALQVNWRLAEGLLAETLLAQVLSTEALLAEALLADTLIQAVLAE